jgi:hypothetical protein
MQIYLFAASELRQILVAEPHENITVLLWIHFDRMFGDSLLARETILTPIELSVASTEYLGACCFRLQAGKSRS